MSASTYRVSEAIVFVAGAHIGQVDKGGQPYILHPLRVMVGLGHGASEDERIVALLHDVVEDTPHTVGQIRDKFGSAVAEAVEALTRRPGEEYGSYIERVARNEIAVKVKIADLNDNLDPLRAAAALAESSIKRYRLALNRLLHSRERGQQQPVETVEESARLSETKS